MGTQIKPFSLDEVEEVAGLANRRALGEIEELLFEFVGDVEAGELQDLSFSDFTGVVQAFARNVYELARA